MSGVNVDPTETEPPEETEPEPELPEEAESLEEAEARANRIAALAAEIHSERRRQSHRHLAMAGIVVGVVGMGLSIIFGIRSNTCTNALIAGRTVAYSCSLANDSAHASYLVFLIGAGLFVAGAFFLPTLRERDARMRSR
jgi:hypothetical protein